MTKKVSISEQGKEIFMGSLWPVQAVGKARQGAKTFWTTPLLLKRLYKGKKTFSIAP